MTPQINYYTCKCEKNAIGPVNVNLKADYSDSQSAVLVTPYWMQSGVPIPVDFVPTITGFAGQTVTITDNNAAPTFTENLFAINMNGNRGIGNLKAFCGKVAKPRKSLTVVFPLKNVLKPNPVIILSPYLVGGTQSVSNSDVVTIAQSHGFVAESLNQGQKYFVNYIAIDRGVTFNPGGLQAEANSVNKTSAGKMRVYFTNPFIYIPVVNLTPWNTGKGNVLNSFETITNITPEYFEFTSTNYGANYFVNWLATASVPLPPKPPKHIN